MVLFPMACKDQCRVSAAFFFLGKERRMTWEALPVKQDCSKSATTLPVYEVLILCDKSTRRSRPWWYFPILHFSRRVSIGHGVRSSWGIFDVFTILGTIIYAKPVDIKFYLFALWCEYNTPPWSLSNPLHYAIVEEFLFRRAGRRSAPETRWCLYLNVLTSFSSVQNRCEWDLASDKDTPLPVISF